MVLFFRSIFLLVVVDTKFNPCGQAAVSKSRGVVVKRKITGLMTGGQQLQEATGEGMVAVSR
jgi:hypothetical protein